MDGFTFADGFTCENHGKKCLKTLYDLYNEKQYVDVSFYVGTQKFEAHKIILVANSEFFMEKLNSTDTEFDFLEFANCDEIAFEAIMRFCYTGKIDYDAENIMNILNLAQLLRIPSLVNGIMNNSAEN